MKNKLREYFENQTPQKMRRFEKIIDKICYAIIVVLLIILVIGLITR